jgi:hypothetical protein
MRECPDNQADVMRLVDLITGINEGMESAILCGGR